MSGSTEPTTALKPTAPVSFMVPDSVLSDDYISTSDIVDSASASPEAVFSNGRVTEVLVVCN